MVNQGSLDLQMQTLKNDIGKELDRRFTEMKAAIDTDLNYVKGAVDNNKNNKPRILTERKAFQNIVKFPGKAEMYEDWHFQLTSFLEEENKEYGEILDKLDKFPSKPTDEELTKIWAEYVSKGIDMIYFNSQLYSVLTMNLTDTALTSIKNLKENRAVRGLLAWWKVGNESNAVTANKVQGLAGRVYSPKRAKKFAETNAMIDEWEINCKRFEEAEGIKLSNQTKIYSLRQIVPEGLERDIIRSGHLDEYIKVRAYITEQVSIRKDMKQTGPVPMELDMAKKVFAAIIDGDENLETQDKTKPEAEEEEESCGTCGSNDEKESNDINELFSFVKGRLKGKAGDDGGKGRQNKFDGYCNGCGRYGHRFRDCWFKDGKGKGDGGKGGGIKGGWPQINSGGKGHWKGGYYGGNGKGGKGGKGKGTYSLDTSAMPSSWTLSLGKCPAPKKLEIGTPPGLNTFSMFRLADLCHKDETPEEEYKVDVKEFPQLNNVASQNKGKMPRMPMNNYSKNQIRKAQEEVSKNKKKNPKAVFTLEKVKTEKINEEMMDMVKKSEIVEKVSRRKIKECCLFEKMPETKTLNPFVGAKPDDAGWVKVEGVMDSGASESVAPPTMCPHYEIRPSPGSLAGQKYVSASEDFICNLGEQELDIVTEEWKESKVKYQIAEVTRPLNAVSEICDAGGEDGQLVIFGKSGGIIYNPATGSQTAFTRKDGIYCLEFWVKPKGFQRQG